MRLPLDGTWEIRSGKLYRNGALIRRSFFDARPSGYHGAVDISCATGTKLRAWDDGTVHRIGDEGGRGFGRYASQTFHMARATREVFVAHLRGWEAKRGEALTEGEIWAISDDTGNSSGPHVHIEMRAKVDDYDRSSRVDPYWILYWLTETKLGRTEHRNPYPVPPEDMRPVQRGDRSLYVMWVQWALGVAMIDGRFDVSLEAKVRAFQEKRFGYSTGRTGPKTRAALVAIRRTTGLA